MLKSSHSNKESSLCWEKADSCRSLRIEQSDGSALIIPYIHLLFTHLEEGGEPRTLLLTFSSHEIRITGTSLSELAMAIQQFTVEWIKPKPPRYRSSSTSAVSIDTIVITERR